MTAARTVSKPLLAFALTVTALAIAGQVGFARTDDQAEPGPRSPLTVLGWMSGSWSTVNGEQAVEEHWTTPDARMMLGMNRTRRGGRTVMFEFLRIVARGDSVLFVALPRGSNETEFALTEASSKRVVFENPSHDFPQRIIYERSGANGLKARVEGVVDGKQVAEEWSWHRTFPMP